MTNVPKFNIKSSQIVMHATSATLTIFLFYSVIFSSNLLGIPFYLDYKRFIMNVIIFTPLADKVLWVSSCIIFSTLFFFSFYRGKRVLNTVYVILYCLVLTTSTYALFSSFEVLGTLTFMVAGLCFSIFSVTKGNKVFDHKKNVVVLIGLYGMIVLAGIEIASLVRWVYHLFWPSLVFADGSWSIAFAEAQIASLLYPILHVLLMIFAFSWIGEFIVKGLLTREGLGLPRSSDDSFFKFRSKKPLFIVTLVSIVLTIFIGYYNFYISRVLNPVFPGTDIPYYTQWLRSMLNIEPFGALKLAMENDRFLYLIMQYSIFPLWNSSPEVFVTFVMPVLLSIFLMFSTFFFVKMGRSTLHAATAMLVTVCSFTVTVGLYGGFLANWLALVFVYIFYAVLMAIMKEGWKPVFLVVAGVMSVAVLYTHPWTWILLVMVNIVSYMVTTVLLILSRKIEMRSCIQELKFMFVLLGVNLLMFYIKGLVEVGSGAGIGGYVDVVEFGLSLFNVFKLGHFLNVTFDWYLGGFYAFAPMFLFAILGVFSFLDYKDRYNRLLLTWILIASLMVFVTFPWQARFLYDMPFNIYTAFGILYGGEHLYRLVSSTELKRLAPMVFWTFYVLSILFLFNYVLRCVVLKQFGPPGLTALP